MGVPVSLVAVVAAPSTTTVRAVRVGESGAVVVVVTIAAALLVTLSTGGVAPSKSTEPASVLRSAAHLTEVTWVSTIALLKGLWWWQSRLRTLARRVGSRTWATGLGERTWTRPSTRL